MCCKIRASIPSRDKQFYLLLNIQIGSGTHPTSYAMDTDRYFVGVSGRGVTTHSHLVSRLIIGGDNHTVCLHGVQSDNFTFAFLGMSTGHDSGQLNH